MKGPETLMEFMELFESERSCRQAIFDHRWPDGFRCPRCKHDRAYEIETRSLFECGACGYQASLTAGTILHKSKTPLKKWLMAIYILGSTKKALSSAELGRQLGVANQTAWTMRRKILHAMRRREGELMLSGIVEMDEAFIGGKEEGRKGRGTEKKTLVAVSAQETKNGKLALAHIQIIPDASGDTLKVAAKKTIKENSTIKTDGWLGYNNLDKKGYEHVRRVQQGRKDASKLLPWVHVVISNFKRWILDIFHGVSPKHLQAYLDEFCYRLNRRWHRKDLFRRILNRCVKFSGPVTYCQLVAS